ncbi:MAG: lysoplasmalogenase [Burkholderiaceae bacterium]
MSLWQALLIVVCALAVLVLLIAERSSRPTARAAGKLVASTAFVLLAISFDAMASDYGLGILVALCLGWLGDALLLSARQPLFLGGLAAFLVSHLCFATAFATRAIDGWVLTISAVASLVLGWCVLRWLRPHLAPAFRWPVVLYVVAILVMLTTAVSLSAAIGRWEPALGALVFAASDLAVARDRFVCPGFVNSVWGLPAYYFAQVVMAVSIVAVA